nr:hypothetical protein Itr_chr12CG30800 [Ipomoea trifida]
MRAPDLAVFAPVVLSPALFLVLLLAAPVLVGTLAGAAGAAADHLFFLLVRVISVGLNVGAAHVTSQRLPGAEPLVTLQTNVIFLFRRLLFSGSWWAFSDPQLHLQIPFTRRRRRRRRKILLSRKPIVLFLTISLFGVLLVIFH